MSRKEVPRPGLLKAALAGNHQPRGRALHLSVRQFTASASLRADGAPGLCHRLRAPSPRRCPRVRGRVASSRPPTSMSMIVSHRDLREVEGLRVSRASVRRIRRALDLPAKHRRRPPPAPRPPPRGPRWAPSCSARRQPPRLARRPRPGLTSGASTSHRHVSRPARSARPRPARLPHRCWPARQHRRAPADLYGDRFASSSATTPTGRSRRLRAHQHPTHFGQILRDLGRLPRRRLPAGQGASSASGAPCTIASSSNSACAASITRRRPMPTSRIPGRLQPRFTHPPRPRRVARRRATRDQLSCRYTRLVALDNTARLGPAVQIPPRPHGRSYAGTRVDLRECVDGRLLVDYTATLVSQPTPARLRPRASRRVADAPLRIAAEAGGRPRIPSATAGAPLAAPPAPARTCAARPPSLRRRPRHVAAPLTGDISQQTFLLTLTGAAPGCGTGRKGDGTWRPRPRLGRRPR